MSQPIQYSNLFFETDPNSLAAKLVQNEHNSQANKREKTSGIQQASQGEGIRRNGGPNAQTGGTGFRPPPRFEGFDDISSQVSISANPRLQSKSVQQSSQYSARESNESRPQSVLSRTWDLATGYGQTPSRSTQFSNQNRSVPVTSTPIRTVHNPSQSAARVIPTDLLSQEIGPRSIPTPAASQASTLTGLLSQSNRGPSTQPNAGRNSTFIAASHAPTFRPPRPAPSNPPKDTSSSSLATSITSFFQVKPLSNVENTGSSSSEFQTSAWFDGPNEQIERNMIPGPAVDAWVLADEMETQCDYSQRDFSERKERAIEELPKYSRSGIFSKGPWLAFCYSFDQPPVLDSDCPSDCLLRKYNCEGILRGELGSNAEKVPFLALAVLKIRFFEHYATATLADPTGDIEAEIHQDVLRSSQWSVQEGAVVVLRHITICRPLFLGEEVSTHTIIITPSNVERVFPCNEPVPDALIGSLPRIISDQNQPRFGKANSTANSVSPSPVIVESFASASAKSHAAPSVITTLPTVIPQPSHIAPKRGRYVEADFDFSDDDDEVELFDINESSKPNKQTLNKTLQTNESPKPPSIQASPEIESTNTPVFIRRRIGSPRQADTSPAQVNSNPSNGIIGAVDDLFNDSPVASAVFVKDVEKKTVAAPVFSRDSDLTTTKPSVTMGASCQASKVQAIDDIGWLDD